MARLCALCRHPERDLIESHIKRGDISIREICRRFDLHKTTVLRHRERHFGDLTAPRMIVAREGEWVPPQPDEGLPPRVEGRTVGKVEELGRHVERVLQAAEDRGNIDSVLAASRELRQNLELRARLLGETKQAEKGFGGGRVVVHIRTVFDSDEEPTKLVFDDVVDAEEVTQLLPSGEDQDQIQ